MSKIELHEEDKKEFLTYPENLIKIRDEEFIQLKDVAYLDHAGSTVYGSTQLSNYMKDLNKNLYGNPHSINPSSDLTSDVIHQVRCLVVSHFQTTLEKYEVVFTSGATAALKLLATTFKWEPGKSKFVYLEDNHTSVVGIRELATSHKASSICLTASAKTSNNQTRSSAFALNSYHSVLVKGCADTKTSVKNQRYCSLFAYPAQSNFSGCIYPLKWIDDVKRNGLPSEFDVERDETELWTVLLDAASFSSTSPLDLSLIHPDFVCLSFYKLFGFPTGLGVLLVNRESAQYLENGFYFGGGTVDGYLARTDFNKPRSLLHNRLEDGTLPFLDILAVKYGFDFLYKVVGRSMVSAKQHTFALAQKMYKNMIKLCHNNGNRVVEIYSYTSFDDSSKQGPILAFNIKRFDGSYVGFNHVLHLASTRDIHLRGGCFCNVGACTQMLAHSADFMRNAYQKGYSCGGDFDVMDGYPVGAVRASLGYMSTSDDVDALLTFLTDSFLHKRIDNCDIISLSPRSVSSQIFLKDIFVYPVKSCRAIKTSSWTLCETGLIYDRAWIIVNDRGVGLTLKREQKLTLIQPSIDLDAQTLTLYANGFGSTTIPIHYQPYETSAKLCQTKVCLDRVEGYDCGKDVADWLSAVLGKNVSLVYKNPQARRRERNNQSNDNSTVLSFTNQAQYLLLSFSSVDYLREIIEARLSKDHEKSGSRSENETGVDSEELIRRFRCNFVVSGCEPFAEETWKGIAIQRAINDGPPVYFDCSGFCGRCSMICIHTQTGKRCLEPLRTLATLPAAATQNPRNNFGVYLRSDYTNVTISSGAIVVAST